MTAASLVGFALALVVVAWLASVGLTGAVLVAQPWLRRCGPATERTATTLAIVMPPMIAVALVVPVVVDSVLAAGTAGADHCGIHDHHAHLCVVHGGAWADAPGAIVALALVGALVLGRLSRLAWAVFTMRRAVARLDASLPAKVAAAELRLVPTTHTFCFVAGVRHPRIYIGAGLWQRLDDEARAALLAHERAHIAQRDPAGSIALAALAAFAPPGLAAVLQRRWAAATERLCDARAVAATSVDAVARALMVTARAERDPAPGDLALAFAPRADLADRVDAVLAEGPTGAAAAQTLSGAALGLLGGVALLAAAAIDPTHHALETLLGVF